MPWRKDWIDPGSYNGKEEDLGRVLGKRAYEVWVSEVSKYTLRWVAYNAKRGEDARSREPVLIIVIVLQQTRVSTVIPYFNNWVSKWPTVQDLADADHDDILSVWKGLGYYSRATRLHEGAKAMIAQSSGSACALPSSVTELQNFPGIGRYTAGAISSIAFGEAEPVLDGNVARVLSRQLGLYMDVKDRKATDALWDVADQLIKHVSVTTKQSTSKIPGQWNQAMMELGSTVCTPRPRCEECPIQKTCRVYSEGHALSDKRQAPTAIPDIEDACFLCEPLDTEDLVTAPEETPSDDPAPATKKRKASAKQANTISHYFGVGAPKTAVKTEQDNVGSNSPPADESRKRKAPIASAVSSRISTYCSLFPKKVAKKKAAEEECVVCMIELCMPDGSSKWLIEQRPAKGKARVQWQTIRWLIVGSRSSCITVVRNNRLYIVTRGAIRWLAAHFRSCISAQHWNCSGSSSRYLLACQLELR